MPSSSAGFCRPSGKVELSSLCGLGGVVIRGPHSTELVPNCLVVTECHGRISRSVSVTRGQRANQHTGPQKGGGEGGRERKQRGKGIKKTQTNSSNNLRKKVNLQIVIAEI